MPTYTPDPTDVTQPTDGQPAGTAAAEFRALKAYIASGSIPKAASQVSVVPVGSIASTDVQSALAEISSDADAARAWIIAVTAASIPFVPAGTLTSTNVQAALQEVSADADAALARIAATTPFTPTGSIVATNVQAAIAEVSADADAALAGKLPAGGTTGQVLAKVSNLDYAVAWVVGGGGGAGTGTVIQDTEPSVVTGTEWYESDTGGYYLRYQNPDATFTWIAVGPTGGDFIPYAQRAAANGVATLDSTGKLTGSQIPSFQNVINRIINGGFNVNQRFSGAIATVAVGGVYTLDRWFCTALGGGQFQVQQAADVTRPGEFWLQAGVSVVDASLGATDAYNIGQSIEGNNMADFNFGSSGAKSFTFSFDVSCSIACTFAVAFRNNAGDRSYVKTFTVSAGIITSITMTVPGDTTGTWLSGSGCGMTVTINTGAGVTYQAPVLDAWQAGNYFSHSTVTNLMNSSGAVFLIRAVRLYPGSVDYGPGRRLYAEELAMCKRYFHRYGANGSNPNYAMPGYINASTVLDFPVALPVPMRTIPTIGGSGWAWSSAATPAGNQVSAFNPSIGTWLTSTHTTITPTIGNFDQFNQVGLFRLTGSGGAFNGTVGNMLSLAVGSTAYIDVSAEL